MGKKELVRTYYDQYASNYDTFYSPIQRDKFQQLSSYLGQPAVLLDLGGGSGVVSEWLDSVIVNIDISTEMIRKGLSKGRTFLAVAADLENLPFRNKSAPHAISLTAIQNCETPLLALFELQRILSTEHKAVVTVLKKKIDLESFSALMLETRLQYDQISYSGEDIMFYISSSNSKSS